MVNAWCDGGLIGSALSGQIDRARGGTPMADKTRYIFPLMITAVIVFVVSAVVTWANIGLHPDFVRRWLSAFILGWPVATLTAFIVIPPVRRLAESFAALLDRNS
jgi:hypothetical protein